MKAILATATLSSLLAVMVLVQQIEITRLQRDSAAALKEAQATERLDQNQTDHIVTLWNKVKP